MPRERADACSEEALVHEEAARETGYPIALQPVETATTIRIQRAASCPPPGAF
jgi:hypothetical protein